MSENVPTTDSAKSEKTIAGLKRLTLLAQAEDYARNLAERRVLENYTSFVGENDKEIKVAISAEEIYKNFGKLTGDAVKRLGSIPFVVIGNEVVMLCSASDVFAYLAYLGVKVLWSDHVAGCMTKGEFRKLIQLKADKYELISDLPSYPKMDGIFYMKDIPPRDTGRLEELVNKFNYANDVDRQLIKAMFMTPFWGGECGQRPAFLIDGLDNDDKGNRGIGKTTVTDALVELCGGSCVDLSSKTDGDEIRKRMLTAYKERIVRMDNIKAQSLSNETLESLITAKRVSGHQMFQGHNSIPNAFTYVLTFNDAVLSKDMSQRCIIIRLKRPKYRAEWWSEVTEFISKYKEDIIADIGYMFTKEAPEADAASRFPKWERAVLGKCAFDLPAIQDRIRRDQENADDDSHLREDIRELVTEKISQIKWKFDPARGGNVYFDPEKNTVAINRTVVYGWVAALFQKSSSRYIAKRFHAAMPKEFLRDFKVYLGSRYLVWSGARSSQSDFLPASAWRVEINGTTTVKEWFFDE